MGPSRANPLTGEILDADIIFDASMVRFCRNEAAALRRHGGEPASLIQATQRGHGPGDPSTARRRATAGTGWNDRHGSRARPGSRPRCWPIRQGLCQCGAHMKYELGLAAMALAAARRR